MGRENNKLEEKCKLLFDGNARSRRIATHTTTSWCNGNTGDSESLIQGSSPCEVTTQDERPGAEPELRAFYECGPQLKSFLSPRVNF